MDAVLVLFVHVPCSSMQMPACRSWVRLSHLMGHARDARGQPIIHPLSMFSDTRDPDIRLSDMRILVSF